MKKLVVRMEYGDGAGSGPWFVETRLRFGENKEVIAAASLVGPQSESGTAMESNSLGQMATFYAQALHSLPPDLLAKTLETLYRMQGDELLFGPRGLTANALKQGRDPGTWQDS